MAIQYDEKAVNQKLEYSVGSSTTSNSQRSSTDAPVLHKSFDMSTDNVCKLDHASTCTPCSSGPPGPMTASSPPVFTPERATSFATMKKECNETPAGATRKRKRSEQPHAPVNDLLGMLLETMETFERGRPHARSLPDTKNIDAKYHPTGYTFVDSPSVTVAPGVARTIHHCINPDCNSYRNFVHDQPNGTICCNQCGSVQPQRIYVEDEKRLFSDDDLETRNSKIRTDTGHGTCVGDKTLTLAQMKLEGPADAVKNEMYEHLAAYNKFVNWNDAGDDAAVYGPKSRAEHEKAAIAKSYSSMATHIGNVKRALDEIASHMKTNAHVKRCADDLCIKFGAQCFIHDRDCCGGSNCRLRLAKKIPVPLAAAALLRFAHLNGSAESVQLEVFKSTLLSLKVSPNVTQKFGKANILVTDMFKGMPFPCFEAFDPESVLFTLIGENQETMGFADLNFLAETVGFTYPQALRAKEILDDMELPTLMPQTVMGLAFLRASQETKERTIGLKEISKLVGIRERTLKGHMENYEIFPFPITIFKHIVKLLNIHETAVEKAATRLYHWLGTTPQSYKAYMWTRKAGPWITPACAVVAGILDVNPGVDTVKTAHAIAACFPSHISVAKIVESYNKHPSCKKLRVSL